jgi:hypothetical protein
VVWRHVAEQATLVGRQRSVRHHRRWGPARSQLRAELAQRGEELGRSKTRHQLRRHRVSMVERRRKLASLAQDLGQRDRIGMPLPPESVEQPARDGVGEGLMPRTFWAGVHRAILGAAASRGWT